MEEVYSPGFHSAWNHDKKICHFLDHEITRSGYKISDFIGAHLESGAKLGNKVWDNVDIDSVWKLKSKRSKRNQANGVWRKTFRFEECEKHVWFWLKFNDFGRVMLN